MNVWFNVNSLYLNPDKTKFLRFHHSQKGCSDLKLKVNSEFIQRAQSVKFLGIFLDENLNFKTHCEYVISRLSSLVYMLKNLRTVLTRQQLITVYYAQVESILRYGLIFWGWSTSSCDVFLVQKRILRSIAGVHRTHSCRDLFRENGVLTLPSLFIQEMSIYVFKKRQDFPLVHQMHNVNTRQMYDFHIPFSKYKLGCRSPNILGPKIFNLLPDDIKRCTALNVFRAKLKQFLLGKCFYSVSEYF